MIIIIIYIRNYGLARRNKVPIVISRFIVKVVIYIMRLNFLNYTTRYKVYNFIHL